ncbi:mercury methylation corrinoid protein HgcA [Nitrospirota bacterium]
MSVISTDITSADKWEHIKCRISGFRNSYLVEPGLYAVGSPGPESDVLVSANYKLSFDHLRSSLKGMDVWVLVLDTKGVNVWCAAGKGTFSTSELTGRIRLSRLEGFVSHKRLIVPQLGAVGISAHEVKKATGFRVHYGPVYASDIRNYIEAGYKAEPAMRRARFNLLDRLVLTPMEIVPAMKFFPKFALVILLLFGLRPEGIIFLDALTGGMPFLVMGLMAVLSGALLTPALLPYLPFRSFALKGYLTGLAATWIGTGLLPETVHWSVLCAAWIWFPLASSYVALQFTGTTTFTGMSGVDKELRAGIPLYIGGTVVSVLLLIINTIVIWRAL